MYYNMCILILYLLNYIKIIELYYNYLEKYCKINNQLFNCQDVK